MRRSIANNNLTAEWHSETLLASLVTVAAQHGIELNIKQIKHDNQLEGTSITKSQFISCAKKAGLKAKFFKGNWQSLIKANQSASVVLLLQDAGSMLLTEKTANNNIEAISLINPTKPNAPSLQVDRTRLEAIWQGDFLLIKRDYDKRDETQPFSINYLFGLVVREKKVMRDIVICAIFLSILSLVPILFFRLLTDKVINHNALNTFTVLCVGLAICVAFETIFTAARRSLLDDLISRVDVKISTTVYERLLKLPMDVFENTPVGLIARNINEVYKIRSFIINQLFGTVLDSLCLVIFIPIMFLFSPLLTLIVLSCCVVMIAWIVAMLPMYARRSSAVQRAEGARGSFLIQSIQGIRTVKSLVLEPKQMKQWDHITAELAKLRTEEQKAINIIQSALVPLEKFLISGPLAIGVYFAMTSKEPTAVAEIFAFLLLSQRIIAPLRQGAQLIEQYEAAKQSVALVSSLINKTSEDNNSGKGVRQPLIGKLEVSVLRFQYPTSRTPALNQIDFNVQPGETLGIMGRSGSGKTTITRLLQRLHSDYDGLIKIDGIDVREYALDHLRGSLGVVLQDNFLFSGTIRENISAAKTSATFSEIVKAARMSGAEEFIDRLPRGYDTYINEGSNNLSGGQKQRIAIARALITDPRMLILDEATSALDPESEAIVNANLKRISEGRTTIIISHRLSSLVSADAIMVLERGKINDIGKHNDLLNRCEIYRDMWNTQNSVHEEVISQKLRLIKGS